MASSSSASVTVASFTTSAQPSMRDRLADRRRVRELDPVPVRLLQQLGLLVLGGGVEPEAGGLHREVPSVLAEAALAHVEDLLALEQRVHDDGPFLARRCHVPTIGGPWTTSILSGDLKLSAHVAVPNPPLPSLGLVLCHGLPEPTAGAATVGTTYPDLADHIANEAGWTVLTFNFRGTGTSEGDFSAHGWLDDLRAAVRALHARPNVRGVWVAGFGTAGRSRCAKPPTITSCAAWRRSRRRARCATGRVDPARLLAHARSMGMIRSDGFPSDATRWVRDIGRVDAVAAAKRLDRRPLLVLHGVEDLEVPVADAGRSPTPVDPTPSCGSCRVRATGCATTRGRSPRCSGGSPARCRAGPTESPALGSARLRRLAASSTASRVASRSCSGCHPVAPTSFALSPTSTGTSTGAHEVGGGDDPERTPGPARAVARRRRRRARRAPSTRCRPRPEPRARRAGRRPARRRARR